MLHLICMKNLFSEKILPRQLIIISFLVLFLELLIIRVVSTEIRIFAYMGNLLLLTIFISSGLGMFIQRKLPLWISASLLFVLSVIIITGVFRSITSYLSPLSESFIWFQSDWNSLLLVGWGFILTTILLLVVVGIFIPLGQELGRQFDSTERPVWMYSLNIFFSLLGIWSFNALSFMSLSPYLGLLLSQLLLLYLSRKSGQLVLSLGVASVLGTLIFLSQTTDVTWSPYQKLAIVALPEDKFTASGYQLQVNNVGYMGLLDLSKKRQEELEKSLTEDVKKQISESSYTYDAVLSNQYDLPFILAQSIDDVLIIGAGGGNDVAGAIRAGASTIDAVEIDPQIIEKGKQYHPEKPYQSSSVSIHVDDGRSFLRQTDKKYDVIIMGLADSHTTSSSLTNVQLDTYLYTEESFKEAAAVLKPNGIMFVSFDVRRPWIGSRIQHNMKTAFGHEPTVFSMQKEIPFAGWGGVIFLQDKQEGQIAALLQKDAHLAEFIEKRKTVFEQPAQTLTDNWPYLYLDQPRLPKIHLVVSFILMSLFFLILRNTPIQGKGNWTSFMLGAGFLLFEFQNISKTALLYGNTWTTNLFTISAILLLILLANLIATRITIKLKLAYALLIVAFALQFIVPVSVLNTLPYWVKYTIGPLYLNIPLLFSGLIFIDLFAKTKNKSAFFASNLIGSAAGGVLSILSFWLGLQSLLFVSFCLYMISGVLSLKKK